VICTDGKANVGVGDLDCSTEEKRNVIEDFYTRAGEYAKQNGVAVSILSIKGTECSLEYLASVSAMSRGINHTADPLTLSKDFACILQNAVVATNVTVKVLIHKGLKFRHEKVVKGCCATRDIGNATKETNVTFEFAQSNELTEKNLPFQVQIYYTSLDESKRIRTITKIQKVTDQREVAEKNLNVAVVGLHTVQQSAQLALEGNYTKARMHQITNHRLMKRALNEGEATETQIRQLKLFEQEADRLDSALRNAKKEESNNSTCYDSASEDDSGEEDEKPKKSINFVARNKSRKQTRNDSVSNVIYQSENPMFSAFTSSSNPLYTNN